MRHSYLLRAAAATLSLSLLAAPAAQALTTEQCAQLLDEIYVDEVPQTVLDQPTIDEMLTALGDPYTQYFSAQEYGAFTSSMSDTSLVGIGVVIRQSEEGPLLDSVLPGSPAEAGGLQAGDLIIAVDGQSTLELDIDALGPLIQGEEGTEVQVTYLRDGKEKTVTLTRAPVTVPTTTSELIDDHIGYISCTTFGPETVGHFQEALDTYGDQATVWIVDLRSNGGGLTEAATDAAGLFTGAGTMLYLRDGEGEYGVYTYEEEAATLYPVIVLVDYYSASSSEIFAAAIRDRGAGIVVGTRTFGKGVAQSVVDQSYMPSYFPEGDAIKITSHRVFAPSGNTTDGVGVIPDLLVDPQLTGEVAYLLAGSSPSPTTAGTLRADLSWQWYVDLETAKEYPQAFQALLNAIPENKKVWLGTDSAQWQLSSLEEVAQVTGTPYSPAVFQDQEETDYDLALRNLKLYGLIHGTEKGTFLPQADLTRAELCQILAVALNCTIPDNQSPFIDVPADAWYAPAVTVMSNMGLVQGTGDGTFRPEDPVDHQQFITIMSRMIQRLNFSFYELAGSGSHDVVGVAEYADWAKEGAWLLSYSQTNYFGSPISLLWAPAHDISPTGHTTREEAAYTLYRLLSYTGILPA